MQPDNKEQTNKENREKQVAEIQPENSRKTNENQTKSQEFLAGEKKLMKTFPKEQPVSQIKTIIAVFLILSAGVVSGYFLSTLKTRSSSMKSSPSSSEEELRVGDVFGVPDKDTFRDDAEGVLVKGGIDGEGSHHLLRPGGESQNVYLTSSVVDLDLFVDHKIKVWAETFKAQKAGWLMDVGRVEIIELKAEKPFEE